MLLILLHAIDIRGRLVGVTSDFFDEFGRDAAYECAGAYIFGYYCSCGYYRSVADGYTGCYGNICPYPYIISDAYGLNVIEPRFAGSWSWFIVAITQL